MLVDFGLMGTNFSNFSKLIFYLLKNVDKINIHGTFLVKIG